MKVERLKYYEELRPFLAEFGEEELPHRDVRVDVLRQGGGIIIGAVMSQEVIHVGPFYLLPEQLGGHPGGLLIRAALNVANGREIHVVAMNSETESLCQRMGMERIDGSLWVRET